MLSKDTPAFSSWAARARTWSRLLPINEEKPASA